MNGDNGPMEYVGDQKFGLPEGGRIKPAAPLETWLENARGDFIRSRAILPVLNSTDEQLERIIRKSGPPFDAWLNLMESCGAALDRYEAGAECLRSAVSRLIVVLERVHGREATEDAYAERH